MGRLKFRTELRRARQTKGTYPNGANTKSREAKRYEVGGARAGSAPHSGDSPIQQTSTRVSKSKPNTKRSQQTTFPRAPCSAILTVATTHTHHTKACLTGGASDGGWSAAAQDEGSAARKGRCGREGSNGGAVRPQQRRATAAPSRSTLRESEPLVRARARVPRRARGFAARRRRRRARARRRGGDADLRARVARSEYAASRNAAQLVGS